MRLSTGQRQRVAVAAGLIGDPALLILDEPSSGLDIAGEQWLRNIILDRTERGLTTLLSSHQLGEARRVVHRAIVINRTLRYDGPFPDLADDALDAWYFSMIGEGQA
jgi:ABC-2 type transport system ATP-binding protein